MLGVSRRRIVRRVGLAEVALEAEGVRARFTEGVPRLQELGVILRGDRVDAHRTDVASAARERGVALVELGE
eukprot:3945907-Alexandrium_andersonii.AAC.1